MKIPIDHLLDTVEFIPLVLKEADKSGDLPYATHKGYLKLGPFELLIYQLNNGQRVIDSESMDRVFRALP